MQGVVIIQFKMISGRTLNLHSYVFSLCSFIFIINRFESECQVHEIYCYCTTYECELRNETTCITSASCYTQWLNKSAGGKSLLQGCTPRAPSLLCLNQRPVLKENSPWPVLSCCEYSFCNNVSHFLANNTENDEELYTESFTTTTSIDTRVLEKWNVSSLKDLKERLKNWNNTVEESEFNMNHFLIISTGLIVISVISAIGFYCVLKYKIIYTAKSYNTLTLVNTQEKVQTASNHAELDMLCQEHVLSSTCDVDTAV